MADSDALRQQVLLRFGTDCTNELGEHIDRIEKAIKVSCVGVGVHGGGGVSVWGAGGGGACLRAGVSMCRHVPVTMCLC